MSAADVIADALAEERLLAGSASTYVASAVLAALSAAGYVVATPEDIRSWPVEQVAELIGGEVVDVGEGFSWVLGPAIANTVQP